MNQLVKINEELEVEVIFEGDLDWLMSTKDVAEGYGLTQAGLRSIKRDNIEELKEGKHWVVRDSHTLGGKQKATFWTKHGVVRLGFFIKTSMARDFRDWAEDFIIKMSPPPPEATPPALPNFTNPAEAARAWAEQYEKVTKMSLVLSRNTSSNPINTKVHTIGEDSLITLWTDLS